MYVNIHRIIENTQSEGPGKRFCVWVQGCSHHCKGCFAQDTWDFSERNRILVEDMLQTIKKEVSDIEGITVLGGEPFDQPEALLELLKSVKSLGLSTLVFTGYLIEQLQTHPKASVREALRWIDVLIDGPYIEAQRSFAVPLIGSSNQKYHFLTDRYTMKDFKKNTIEVRISKDGTVSFNGMGDFPELRKRYEGRLRNDQSGT